MFLKGQKIVRCLQRFNTLFSDFTTSDRPDRALHAMSVMVGKESVKGDSYRLLDDRESVLKELETIGCKDEWLKAEKAAKETLDLISASASLYPYSKQELTASNATLETLGSEVFSILNRVSRGKGKYKTTKDEKKLIQKQQQESEKNKALQKDYDDVVAQRLRLLESSLKQLDVHTRQISQKHQAEFDACRKAARPDVRLVDSKGLPRERETEKVSSELLLPTNGVGS
ncbi:hypothetical protein [Endozoicomonas arenosclerae]|uniref:hypothetical protein n=1 Tax=Endozoicomonas arenosclerae TaxID=1633495 RepID=UPI000A4679F8|nr:hypothetical protein [Endozoicomonas arenosclerae]